MYFNFELSWILVPLGIFLYYKFNNLKIYLNYSLIFISIIGMIDTGLSKKDIVKGQKYQILGLIQFYLSILFHFFLIFSLVNYNDYSYPNLISFILFIFGILIILFLPYWPYKLTKQDFIILDILFYLTFIIYHLIYSKKINFLNIS